jgi:menaquinone-dependent protoporphyrinogen oxidase
MTRLLLAYGSKRGSTGEIAKAICRTFEEMGLEVDVRPAAEVEDVGPYGAVVLGGAVYKNRWHRDARRFGRRFAGALRNLPVWLFSSGPLDLTAEERKIPPVPFVAKLAERIGARDHATFGGRLAMHPSGYATAPWPSGWRETTGTSPRSVRGPPASVVRSGPGSRHGPTDGGGPVSEAVARREGTMQGRARISEPRPTESSESGRSSD